MTNLKDAGQQLKQALDKIAQAKANPEQVQAAVDQAKQKLTEMLQAAQQEQD